MKTKRARGRKILRKKRSRMKLRQKPRQTRRLKLKNWKSKKRSLKPMERLRVKDLLSKKPN